MKTVFIGKNNKPYAISDLEIANILNNEELLNMYSMSELHELYTKYFGVYVAKYPYILSQKIKLYDNSDNVNSFFVNGKKMWLDKATRVGLMHLINCSSDSIQLVLGNELITFPIDQAKNFLTRLELYASQCYLQTQKHLLAVKDLKTVEEVLNYDYTAGYPEKITLE